MDNFNFKATFGSAAEAARNIRDEVDEMEAPRVSIFTPVVGGVIGGLIAGVVVRAVFRLAFGRE